jgi:hypothetical protein
MIDDLDEFARAYAKAALWASVDEASEPPSAYGFERLSPAARRAIWADCDSFLRQVRDAGIDKLAADRAGNVARDFWLTRCHHGAGFRDGGYPDPAASELTRIAHSFDEVHLYIGDDGLIYQAGSEDR